MAANPHTPPAPAAASLHPPPATPAVSPHPPPAAPAAWPGGHPSALVGCDWLAAHLRDADVRVLDCTFLLPPAPGAVQAAFAAAHIEGAAIFDIEAVCDHASPLPHMLPSPALFAEAVGALGIGNAHHVVLYDDTSVPGATPAGAARVWWTFRAFGHARVSVLDGGLAKWRAQGRATTAIATPVAPTVFRAALQPASVRTQAQVEANITTAAAQLVDARSAGRFRGADPEPRPGLRRGHIPGALNVPFTTLLDPSDRTWLPPERLREVFASAGVALDAPVITTCGSGVTACVVALALHLLGHRDVAVYDGSWAEWGQDGHV